MVHANKIWITKYKPEYIIKRVGIYMRQKWILRVDSITIEVNDINWA